MNGKNGKDKGNGKHKGKLDSNPKFEGCCVYCGKRKHTVDTRTLLQHEQQHDTSHTTTSWFVIGWDCAVHDGIDLHADRWDPMMHE